MRAEMKNQYFEYTTENKIYTFLSYNVCVTFFLWRRDDEKKKLREFKFY